MFTDIVDSTAMTARLGDERSVEMVRAHDSIVRRSLKNANGSEVKHTGDGIMASFTKTINAVNCARSILSSLETFNMASAEKLNLRIGMDAGEPVADSNDLFGSTVQLAARLCAAADKNSIFVTEAVRAFASSAAEMIGRGTREMKGFSQGAGAIASILGLVAGGLAYISLGASLFHIAAIIIALSAALAITYRPTETLASSNKNVFDGDWARRPQRPLTLGHDFVARFCQLELGLLILDEFADLTLADLGEYFHQTFGDLQHWQVNDVCSKRHELVTGMHFDGIRNNNCIGIQATQYLDEIAIADPAQQVVGYRAHNDFRPVYTRMNQRFFV